MTTESHRDLFVEIFKSTLRSTSAARDGAAFHVGDHFDHAEAPFKLQVLKRLPGDIYSLDIQLKD